MADQHSTPAVYDPTQNLNLIIRLLRRHGYGLQAATESAWHMKRIAQHPEENSLRATLAECS